MLSSAVVSLDFVYRPSCVYYAEGLMLPADSLANQIWELPQKAEPFFCINTCNTWTWIYLLEIQVGWHKTPPIMMKHNNSKQWKVQPLIPWWRPCRWQSGRSGWSPAGPNTTPTPPLSPWPVSGTRHLSTNSRHTETRSQNRQSTWSRTLPSHSQGPSTHGSRSGFLLLRRGDTVVAPLRHEEVF